MLCRGHASKATLNKRSLTSNHHLVCPMLNMCQHCSYSALRYIIVGNENHIAWTPLAVSTKVALHAIEPKTNIVTFKQNKLDQIAAVAGPIWPEGNWLP